MTRKIEKILVVDDNPETVKFLVNVIHRNTDCGTVEASNGAEALRCLYKVDLILLDVFMPIMNGLEFFRKIRDIPAYRNLPVIFMTFTASTGLHDYINNSPYTRYIDRPIQEHEILQVINELEYENELRLISST